MNLGELEQKLELGTAAKEIFKLLEEESVRTPERVVDEYLTNNAMLKEIAGGKNDIGLFSLVSKVMKDDVIPLYQVYDQEKKQIIKNSNNRKLWKYVLGTVVVANVIEAAATRFASLRPQVLLPTLALEAGAGVLCYKIAGWNDRRKIRKAKKKFFKAVDQKNLSFSIEQTYDRFVEYKSGELLDGQTIHLLGQYDSPDDFWKDYKQVVDVNPANSDDLEHLDVNRFGDFLKIHVEQNSRVRERRLNELFLNAHLYFLHQDEGNYARESLANS